MTASTTHAVRRDLRPEAWAAALRTGIGPLLAEVVLPFALVFYLAMRGAGYDAVVRGEVGIAIWWIILLGVIVGLLPAVRLTPWAKVALGCLGAYLVWTALGLAWSNSDERTMIEVTRVACYLGVFALALLAQRNEGLRRMVGSIAAAIALVAILALLSRLHPSWFPADEAGAAFDRARLNYPLNYWNGLATLMAIGAPLLLAVAVEARRVLVQALATATLPVVALVIYMTLSRGGAAAAAIGLIAFFVLYPRRLRALVPAVIAAAGSALLIASLTQRDALQDALGTSAARSQGDEMFAVVLVVCVGVGLVAAAAGLAARHELVPAVRPSRTTTRTTAVIAAVTVLIIGVVALASGELSSRWEEFKATGVEDARAGDRFASANGNNRYQYWETAVDANQTAPLIGTGPGTYETFWTRERPWALNIRDAHSLYLENLAELGIVGFLLIVAFVGGVVLVGARFALRAEPSQRPWLAAATAGCVAFAVAAGVDWAWEQAVLPIAFLLLAAGLVGHRRVDEPADAGPARHAVGVRAAWGVGAVIAIGAIMIPVAGTQLVRDSQADVRSNQVAPALDKAQQARDVEPWAGTPALQEALVLELDGQFEAGAVAAREATEDEPDDWRTWFVLSRLEARSGDAAAALDAYRRAKELNPQSPLFETGA